MNTTPLKAKLSSLAVAAAFSAAPLASHASGFALIEQSGSGAGNAYSGAAAAAEDASTIYFNPAGMSLLPSGKQLSIAVHSIMPSTKFNNSASVNASFVAATSNVNGGDAGRSAVVPNIYFATDIAPNWRFGLAINVPFGLATEYPIDWIGRFQAVKSKLETLNINPSVSNKFSDSVSLGFGLNYQKIDATLTSQANYLAALAAGGAGALIPATIAAGQGEGLSTLKGNDSSWGWNAGAMFKLSSQTRLGIAYRSRIKYAINGTVTFDNRPAALAAGLPNGNIKLDLRVPDNLSFALSHTLNDRWQLLGDLTWTGWNVLQKLEVKRSDNIPASGDTLNNIPYNWRNTWRAGIGANYKMNDAWTLKTGLAYDQTPTNNTDRGPRLPDGNRTWLSFGAKYALSKASTFDLAYAHLFVSSTSVNTNAGGNATNSTVAYGLVNGTYSGKVDIVSVQYSYSF